MMTAAQLAAASLLWQPATGNDDAERHALAAAIVRVTNDAHERALLMVTAVEESKLDRRVFRCRKTGDGGRSVGPWQTYAVSPAQRRAICSDLVTAARVALRRIHQSQEVCRFEPAKFQLAAYASGRCSSRVGRAISERRHNRAKAAVRAAEEGS